MKRILFIFLWIAVLLFIGQLVYFVFFSVRAPKFNEGLPLSARTLSAPTFQASSMCLLDSDKILIGTEGQGLHVYDIVAQNTEEVPVPEELKTARVRSMLRDRQGRLWIGTSKDGLFVGNSKNEWKHYDIASRIPAIASFENDIVLATENGLVRYDLEADGWSNISLQESENGESSVIQPLDLTFAPQGNLYVVTACNGIFRLDRNDTGGFAVSKHVIAKRRFGSGSAPNVSPVPLDPSGDEFPSNQVNAVHVGSDGTVWAGTAAGLAWSRDGGESWHFLRGRDYGDKMRGLYAGTPYKWKELPRVRFGELLPEDDITRIFEDRNGILWIVTNSLGCIAIRPDVFYREMPPKSDQPETAVAFLEEMAKNTTRYHATKSEQIVADQVLPNGKILLASRSGALEELEYPVAQTEAKSVEPTQANETPNDALPSPWIKPEIEGQTTKPRVYPHVAFLGADYITGSDWQEKYGKTYALIGGGEMQHDKLIAFDESICKVRLFVGNVGNRTRPLERTILVRPDKSNPDRPAITAWSSVGNTVPKTADGQHLWCEVKLNNPGRYRLALFFLDADTAVKKERKTQMFPNDYLVEIFPEPGDAKGRIPKGDWQEQGRRADQLGIEEQPLARARVHDFGDGVYKNFELAGPGTYYVKIDKNYSRKVDLCSVLINRLDSERSASGNIPEMSTDQSSDVIP